MSIELLCCVEEYGRHWAYLVRSYYIGLQEDALRMRYRKARKFYEHISTQCRKLSELKCIKEREIDLLFVLVAIMKYRCDLHLKHDAALPEVLRKQCILNAANEKLRTHQLKFYERARTECRFDELYPILLNMCNLKHVHDTLLLFEAGNTGASLFDLLLR